MRIGDGQIFQDTLDGAILTERPVQGIERDIRPEFAQHRTRIAPDIHPRHSVALGFECIGA